MYNLTYPTRASCSICAVVLANHLCRGRLVTIFRIEGPAALDREARPSGTRKRIARVARKIQYEIHFHYLMDGLGTSLTSPLTQVSNCSAVSCCDK